MRNKFVALMIIIVVTGLLLVACSSGTAQQSGQTSTVQQTSATTADTNTGTSSTTTAGTSSEKTFTAAELSKFDGQNGNPTYVAVHGVVYDFSKVPQWNGGKHNGLKAGKDLTKEFDTLSPHSASTLSKLPIVGKYIEK